MSGLAQYAILSEIRSYLTTGNLIIDLVLAIIFSACINFLYGSFNQISYNSISRSLKRLIWGKPFERIIEFRYDMSQDGWVSSMHQGINNRLLDSINLYLANNNVKTKSCRVVLSAVGEHDNIYKDEKLRKKFYEPMNEVVLRGEFDGIRILLDYNVSPPKDKENGGSITMEMRITSYISGEQIDKFIDHCRDLYVDAFYLHLKDQDNKFIYNHYYSEKTSIGYNTYNISYVKTFDDIFFPEKQRLVTYLNKFLDGNVKNPKFNLLLHGSPGCGKTSIIKALANHTDRSIKYIKFSEIHSLTDAIEIFFGERIKIKDNFGSKYIKVPTNKLIMVLEDIDAENKIVHRRSSSQSDEESKKEPADNTLKSIIKAGKKKEPGITLSDILQLFDGLYECKGLMIVMTTNHVKKLDPALIRNGRVTMEINLREMTCQNAIDLIGHYFPEEIDNHRETLSDLIIDHTLTPAQVEAMCEEASGIEDILKALRKHYSM